jgi:transglutaminase superfamily protein
VLPAALSAVVLVRVCVPFLPLRTWERAAARRLQNRGRSGASATVAHDVAWAVRCVSRAVPGATCLTQALAAQLLLSRRGVESRLRIGVARTPAGRLRAHAWLESDGVVVLGGAGMETYTPLTAGGINAADLFGSGLEVMRASGETQPTNEGVL